MKSLRFLPPMLCAVLFALMLTPSCGKPSLSGESSSDISTELSETGQTTEYSTKPDTALILKRQKDVLSRVNNKKSYDELITKMVDINTFIQEFEPSPAGYTHIPSLAEIDEKIGIECIRKSKEKNYYSVHKLKQGGLLYIFYITFESSNDRLLMHDWFVSQKSLSYADFSKIIEGSKLEEAEAIDPVASIYGQRVNNHKPSYDIFYSRHYLTDGILTLIYEHANGKWTVANTDYYNNFQIVHWNRSSNPDYKAKILDIDAIK